MNNYEEEQILHILYGEEKYEDFINKYILFFKPCSYNLEKIIIKVVKNHMTDNILKIIKNKVGEKNSIAQNLLGYCYELGYCSLQLFESLRYRQQSYKIGVNNYIASNEKDLKKAFKLYKLSASQGNVSAQCCLGCCYQYGIGIKKDLKKSCYFYKLSASLRNSSAQNNLGYCYQYGIGIKKDLKEAIRLYNLSLLQGNIHARSRLKNMDSDFVKIIEDNIKNEICLTTIDSLLRKIGYDIVKIVNCYI